MKIQKMQMVWILVKDFEKAVKFYTETVGLKLMNISPEWGWAELQGHDGGARIGIAQHREEFSPGINGVMTFNVPSLEAAMKELSSSRVKAIGEVQEVPGHVKMQTYEDLDGNKFQIVEMLSEEE